MQAAFHIEHLQNFPHFWRFLEMEKEALFAVPKWAIKPSHGTHLDVTKNDNLIQVINIGIFLNNLYRNY